MERSAITERWNSWAHDASAKADACGLKARELDATDAERASHYRGMAASYRETAARCARSAKESTP